MPQAKRITDQVRSMPVDAPVLGIPPELAVVEVAAAIVTGARTVRG